MKIFKLSDMHKGWFVGDFKPTAFATKDFEVNYRTHPAGSNWEVHYHSKTTEINLIVKGKMKFNGTILEKGSHKLPRLNVCLPVSCEISLVSILA